MFSWQHDVDSVMTTGSKAKSYLIHVEVCALTSTWNGCLSENNGPYSISCIVTLQRWQFFPSKSSQSLTRQIKDLLLKHTLGWCYRTLVFYSPYLKKKCWQNHKIVLSFGLCKLFVMGQEFAIHCFFIWFAINMEELQWPWWNQIIYIL